MIALRNLDLKGMEGKSVVFFLQSFCSAFGNISEITFASYLKQPGLNSRLSSYLEREDTQLLAELNRASSTIHLPLWSIFPHLALESRQHVNFFVDSASTHSHGPKAERYHIAAEDLTTHGINGVTRQLLSDHGLSVCSDVKLKDGTRLQIPMMDFSIAPSDANQELLLSTLRKAGHERGILVNSGNSYHFYGSALITEAEFRTFLGHSLLLSPITDARYIAHRLIDGYCNLRILDLEGVIPRISVAFQPGSSVTPSLRTA